MFASEKLPGSRWSACGFWGCSALPFSNDMLVLSIRSSIQSPLPLGSHSVSSCFPDYWEIPPPTFLHYYFRRVFNKREDKCFSSSNILNQKHFFPGIWNNNVTLLLPDVYMLIGYFSGLTKICYDSS